MNELPPGWSTAELAETCTSITDGDHQPPPQVEDGIPFLVIGNVRSGDVDFTGCRHVPEDYFDALAETRKPRRGDVLLTLVGSYGIPVLVRQDMPFCVQRHIGILRPSHAISSSYLALALADRAVFDQATKIATGSAQMTVPLSGLRRIVIPIPPRQEQDRIAAAIEEQFSRVDAGGTALNQTRRNLTRMRAAVLQAAVTGQLVPQDSHDEPASVWLQAHGRNGPGHLTSLPPGWARTTIGELKTWSLYGPRFTSDDYVDSGVPVLRTTDITRNGRILVDQAPKLALSEAELRKYRVMAGDILLTRTGSIGTVAFIRDDTPAIPGAYLILYRFGLPIEFSEFLFLLFQAPSVQRRLVGKSAGIGRPNLNAPAIDATVVDVPPFAELIRIVDAVKRILSSLEGLESELVVADTWAQRLRSSILAAAFSGKLVPQDPTDKPASTLLAHIAAERAASDSLKRVRPRTSRLGREQVTA
jgi:type I restriction enzyme, S subunit